MSVQFMLIPQFMAEVCRNVGAFRSEPAADRLHVRAAASRRDFIGVQCAAPLDTPLAARILVGHAVSSLSLRICMLSTTMPMEVPVEISPDTHGTTPLHKLTDVEGF